jgi:hypothetical protein
VLGGNELANFTRSGDTITLTERGLFGTVASSHKAQDRLQMTVRYQAQPVSDIIYNLMLVYGGVPSGFMPLVDWRNEVNLYLGRLYTVIVCEPTSLDTLISELIQQACLSIWWDDEAQIIRLQVLRGIVTDAATFNSDNILGGTLTIKEQPEKRLSQVWVYFGRINPLKSLTDTDNYRSTSVMIDEAAEQDYGTPAIKKIYSRWIPELGRTVADRLGSILLGRFATPPRRLTFDLQRYAGTDIELGIGYRIGNQSIQDDAGGPSDIPIQVTRINTPSDRFKVEAEEMLFTAPGEDLGNRLVIVDANINNVNLRTAHDSLYPPCRER